MSRLRLAILFVAAVFVLLAAAQADAAVNARQRIDIVDFAYQPSNVTVQLGDLVGWINLDAAPHTVTSDTGLFDSGTLTTGQVFRGRAIRTGTFNYHCSIHPAMKGTVTVMP